MSFTTLLWLSQTRLETGFILSSTILCSDKQRNVRSKINDFSKPTHSLILKHRDKVLVVNVLVCLGCGWDSVDMVPGPVLRQHLLPLPTILPHLASHYLSVNKSVNQTWSFKFFYFDHFNSTGFSRQMFPC